MSTAQAAPPSGTIITTVNEFNRTIKILVNDLAQRYTHDAIIGRVKARIALAIDLDPVCVAKAVGPHLFKYADSIYGGDGEFFIDNDYTAEVEKSANAESVTVAQHIIPKVKAAWRDSDLAGKAAYLHTVQSLLDIYLDYLELCGPGP
jgi:hypothetical protein